MTNPIHALLADAKLKLARVERKIADAERERDILHAQVEAYQQAAEAVDSASLPQAVEKALLQSDRFVAAERITAPKTRPAKQDWKAVFAALHYTWAGGFGYDEIAAAAEKLGVPFKRASLRTKMMNYVNDGYIDRVDNGRFLLTEAGVQFFDVEKYPSAEKNEPHNHKVGGSAGEREAGTFPKPWNQPSDQSLGS